jgi:SPASM domain peptide maturase of grasp-with-spasm system
MNLYSEAIQFNTCLNCKASIDTDGEIKNCPSMKKSFGNYREVSLLEIVKKPEFKKLWTVKKDDIEVCRDCEFRYICTDCRVFIKNLDNIFSQPLYCTYNPYIARWKGEEGYIPVEESLRDMSTVQ